jgi:hypothetical protein
MHWRTWALALAAFAVFLAVNFACDPGIGPRRPPQPQGFELERYFGWPAWYRVELWDSDDAGMNNRSRSDFRWYDPASEMNLRKREVGWTPAALNLLFALLVAVAVSTLSEATQRESLGRRATIILVAVAAGLIGLYWLADRVEVYL